MFDFLHLIRYTFWIYSVIAVNLLLPLKLRYREDVLFFETMFCILKRGVLELGDFELPPNVRLWRRKFTRVENVAEQ